MSEQKFQLRIVSFCLFSWPIHSKNRSSLPTKDKIKADYFAVELIFWFNIVLFSWKIINSNYVSIQKSNQW